MLELSGHVVFFQDYIANSLKFDGTFLKSWKLLGLFLEKFLKFMFGLFKQGYRAEIMSR